MFKARTTTKGKYYKSGLVCIRFSSGLSSLRLAPSNIHWKLTATQPKRMSCIAQIAYARAILPSQIRVSLQALPAGQIASGIQVGDKTYSKASAVGGQPGT